MSVKIEFVKLGEGKDSLSGKNGKGATVIMNGKERFFSEKSFWQILRMELGEGQKEDPEIVE